MALIKDSRLDPLTLLRTQLVAARREGASVGDLRAVVQAQTDLEAIDRALGDELKSAH